MAIKEQLATCNPAVAVRLIRDLAGRIADGPPRHTRGGHTESIPPA